MHKMKGMKHGNDHKKIITPNNVLFDILYIILAMQEEIFTPFV